MIKTSSSDIPCIVLLCLILLYITPDIRTSASPCSLQLTPTYEEFENFENGDVIIGTVISVHSYASTYSYKERPILVCLRPYARNYINFANFIYAIEVMRMEPAFLPNVTVGYHLFDSCTDPGKAIKSVLQILSGPLKTVPNYFCTEYNKLLGIVGDHHSVTTVPMAQILGMYGYTQISYGATDSALSDRNLYPHFFRMLQNDRVFYKIICRVLKHYGWTWVGIIASDDDSGESEHLALMKYMADYGICVDFLIKVNINTARSHDEINKKATLIQASSAKIIIIIGSFNLAIITVLMLAEKVFYDKTLILPPAWTSNSFFTDYFVEVFNGSLTIELSHFYLPSYGTFFDNINPSSYPNNKFLENIWISEYGCLSPNASKNALYAYAYNAILSNCTGMGYSLNIKEHLHCGVSPRVYYAVIAMMFALREMHEYLKSKYPGINLKTWNYRNQMMQCVISTLHHIFYTTTSVGHQKFSVFLRAVKNSYPLNNTFVFDKLGEYSYEYVISQWRMLPRFSSVVTTIGYYILWLQENEQLVMLRQNISWRSPTYEVPRSQCSDNCLPGYRKMPGKVKKVCCYDCTKCPEGEISNRTDSENCIKCSEYEWPNEEKSQCVPNVVEFLSYDHDALAAVFSFVSVLFFIITAGIIVLYCLNKDTAIVKANNTNLSFVLLVSIMLSFLCVFLFIGRPEDLTCMMRHSAFTVIFSVAISSVLGKTTMIYAVFKASKPGSAWRNWISMKRSNYLVLLFTTFQIFINIIWLTFSPPFQELDMLSYQGKIIIQCNEGSVTAFYSVLGYMGFLAAVSFIMAFLARTLPDSFNEAKYITFSMLVFCSVWIATIPTFLSTKGKDTVSVEIFAILASSTGLLVCIFFPKCFIILLRPEINTKSHLLGNRKKTISI